jgi:hypothetical protein
MSSTYSELKFELIGTGEQSGTWGATTNTNIGTAVNEAIAGLASVDTGSTNYTFTWIDSPASQLARNFSLNLYTTGTQSAPFNVVVPTFQKPYMVANTTTQTATIKTAAGTGVAIPSNRTTMVYANGANVVPMFNYMPAMTLGTLAVTTAIPLTSGGTGSSTIASGVVTSNGTVLSSVPAPSGDLVGTTATQELTNKQITPRVNVTTSTSTTSPDVSQYDMTSITAQTVNLTFQASFLAPSDGSKYIFRVQAAATVTVSFDSGSNGFRAVGVLLPTSISSGRTIYLGCIYNSAVSRWDVIALSEN